MQLEKNPTNPVAERQKEELRKAGGQAMIPLAPEGQSLADEQAAALEAQAAQLRAEGGQASIPLAQGLTQPVPAAPVVPQREPAQVEAPAQPSGLMMEAAAIEKEGKQAASLIDQGQLEIEKKAAEIEAQRKAQQDKINSTIQEIESTKIEPKSFWEGKSTGQKVAAGIGLFFASLTPEGARNAVAIIDREIERDLGAQRANLSKKQNTLSALEKQLGSIDAAESAFRLKALQGIELQLKSTAEKAKGPLARAKAQQGLEQIEASKAKAQQDLQLKLMEIDAKKGEKQKLSGEEVKRLDLASSALTAIQGMRQALARGSNTFSVVGDNDFTLNQRLFSENLGRLQSGGAINESELKNFNSFTPSVTDSPEMQMKKLDKMEQMMKARITSLGKDPSEAVSGLKGISFKAK